MKDQKRRDKRRINKILHPQSSIRMCLHGFLRLWEQIKLYQVSPMRPSAKPSAFLCNEHFPCHFCKTLPIEFHTLSTPCMQELAEDLPDLQCSCQDVPRVLLASCRSIHPLPEMLGLLAGQRQTESHLAASVFHCLVAVTLVFVSFPFAPAERPQQSVWLSWKIHGQHPAPDLKHRPLFQGSELHVQNPLPSVMLPW